VVLVVEPSDEVVIVYEVVVKFGSEKLKSTWFVVTSVIKIKRSLGIALGITIVLVEGVKV
jgi:hypothetical protein